MASSGGSISSGSSGAAYSGGGGGGGLSGGSSGAAYSGGGGGGWAGGSSGGYGGRKQSYEDLLRLLYPERYTIDQAAQDPFAKYETAFQSLGGINAVKALPPELELPSVDKVVTTPYGTISTTNPEGRASLEQAVNPTGTTNRAVTADAYRANPTPENLEAYKQSISQQNVRRFGWSPGVEGLPPVAQANAAQREAIQAEKYKNHLLDNFINPDRIGNAKLYTDESGRRRMDVPTIKQEEKAKNLSEKEKSKVNKVRKAAMRARMFNNDTAALALEDAADTRAAQYGGVQSNYDYWLNKIMGW